MNPTERCILCGTDVEVSPYRDDPLVVYLDCLVCGKWEKSAHDGSGALPLDRNNKHLISAFIRDYNKRTGKPYRLSDRKANGRLPDDLVDPPVLAKIDKALLLIAERSKELGSQVTVNVATDWPLVVAHGSRELERILQELRIQRLIEPHGSSVAEVACLTSEGWRRVEALRGSARRGKQAFVAMCFDKQLDQAYAEGIKPALIECGYEPLRIDKKIFNGKICDHIVMEIRRSGLLVADMTMHRQGVYFEAGFAMGLGIPIVWTCRHDEIEKAHFDTRQYSHLPWEDPASLRSAIVAHIEALYPRSTAGLGRPVAG
jgi:hypothetical protein